MSKLSEIFCFLYFCCLRPAICHSLKYSPKILMTIYLLKLIFIIIMMKIPTLITSTCWLLWLGVRLSGLGALSLSIINVFFFSFQYLFVSNQLFIIQLLSTKSLQNDELLLFLYYYCLFFFLSQRTIAL